jgi:hypothetical protein
LDQQKGLVFAQKVHSWKAAARARVGFVVDHSLVEPGLEGDRGTQQDLKVGN